MAGDDQIKKIDITSDTGQQKLEAKAGADLAKEAPDLKKTAVENAQKAAADEISRANLANGEKGGQLDQETQKYLNEYFAGAIDRFDKDPDGKISQKEADEFQTKMLEKTRTILADVKKDAENVNKSEKAAAQVEQMKIEDVKKNIGEIAEIGKEMDLKQSIEQFEKLQQQNTAFQQSIQTQINSIQEFGKSLSTFKEDQTGWSWFSYAAKKAFTSKIETQKAQLEQSLNEKKAAAAATLADLTGKKAILDKNAEAIKLAIAQARTRIIKERDDKLAEIEAEKQAQSADIAAKKAKHDEIAKTQEDLEARQKGLAAKQANNAELQKTWAQTKSEERWDLRKTDMESSNKDAEAELRALKLLYDDPGYTPEAKEQVKAEMDKVQERLKRGQTGVKLADERISSGQKIERKLSEEEASAASEMSSLDKYLNGQVKPSKESLEKNISQLEALKLQYSNDSTEVKSIYNKRVEEIDKINEGVNDFIFASAVGRNKSLEALRKSTESLNNVTIETKSLWNPLNWVQAPLQGVANTLGGIARWIDGNTGDLLKETRDRFKEAKGFWGKLGWGFAHGLTQVAGAFTGFVSGGLELVGGVFNMAAHPLESLNGIGTLLGTNVKEGKFFDGETFKSAWKNLGKAVIGYDEWEKGNYGTSVGKFAFNVMSMLVGAGEGGAVSKAGDAAKVARMAELDAALAKVAGEAGAAEVLAGLGKVESFTSKLAALAKIDAELAATTLSASRVAYLKVFAKTLVVESIPTFAKDAFSAGKAAHGAWATTKAVAGSLAESGWAGAKAVGRGIRDLFPKNIKNIFADSSKLTEASKFKAGGIASVYANLLYAPVGAVRAIGRVAMDLPHLWRTFRGEGLAAAYRAAKIGKAGEVITAEAADFAKAREKIAEIIEKDPALKELAATNEFGLAAAEGKARIQLMKTDPKLAASFSKVEKASEVIQSESAAIQKDTMAKLTEIKNDPQIAKAVAEHDLLKSRVDEAKLADAKNTGGKSLATTNAEKELAKFTSDPDKMAMLKKHTDAAAAETNLNTILGKQKELFTDLTGKRSPELAKLEGEIGEARARYVSEGKEAGVSRPPLESTEPVIAERTERYKAAVEKGDMTKAAEIRNEFGPVKPGSALEQHLDAIEAMAKDTPDKLSARKAHIQEFKDGSAASPEVAKARAELSESLASGDVAGTKRIIDRYKSDPVVKKYTSGMEAEVFEYQKDPANMHQAYIKNQDVLFQDYKRYNEAIAKGDTITAEGIKIKHPEYKTAFDQLDSRYNIVDRNNALTHDMAAVKVKADLIAGDVITEGMTPREAADALSRRYQKYNSDRLGVADAERMVETEPVKIDGKSYRVAVDVKGEVRLISEDGKFVQNSKEFAAKIDPGMSSAGALKSNVVPATSVTAPSSSPSLSSSTKATPVAPPELAEYEQLKAARDQAQKSVAEQKLYGKQDPAELRQKINNNFGSTARYQDALDYFEKNPQKLSMEEIRQVAETASKDTAFSMHSNSDTFVKALDKLAEDKAASIGAAKRYASLGGDLSAAESSLSAFEGSAKMKAVKDYEAAMASASGAPLVGPQAAPTVATKPLPQEPAAYKKYQDLQQSHEDALINKAKLEQPHGFTEVDARNSVFKNEAQAKAFNEYFQKNDHHLTPSEISELTGELSKNTKLGEITDPKKFTEALESQTKSFAESVGAESRYTKASKAAESAIADIEKFKKSAEFEAVKEYEAAKGGTSATSTPSAIPASTAEASSSTAAIKPDSATRFKEVDQAIEANKQKWGEKLDELGNAEKNLQLAKETRERMALRNPNDPKLAILDTQIKAGEVKVAGIKGEVGVLESELSQLRSDWRGALASRGGEKIVSVLTAPYRTQWVQNQIARIKRVAGLPGEAVRAFTSLLSVEGKALAYQTVQFFVTRGKKLNAFMQNIFQANNNADDILVPLGQISDEQFRIMVQLSRAKAVPAAEMANFSKLPLSQKLALLDEGWEKLSRVEASKSNIYSGNDQAYIGYKKAILDGTVDALSGQASPTAAEFVAALDQQFGPPINEMGKAYDITTNGITVHVAADGKRTYEGVERWAENVPKLGIVSGAFSEAAAKYPAMSASALATANDKKPIKSPEEYRQFLVAQVTSDIAQKLGSQPLTQPMTIRSVETTSAGAPVFVAKINEKGQIQVEVDQAWSNQGYLAIKSKPAPSHIASSSPRKPSTPKPAEAPSAPDDPYAEDPGSSSSSGPDIYS